MALDERARHELFLRLEQALGPESAETLMELLPPVGWADVATRRDLDALEERMNLRFEIVDQRFESLENKLLAAFRSELLAQSNLITGMSLQITAQTRTLLIANVGTVLSLAALAFAAAKLA
ncbi:MAG TPA: hypothetical protein VFE55_17670 [Acidimicrobiia bacterium]|nr:hypothetical protein [Acidimicrobiia bacterium]